MTQAKLTTAKKNAKNYKT